MNCLNLLVFFFAACLFLGCSAGCDGSPAHKRQGMGIAASQVIHHRLLLAFQFEQGLHRQVEESGDETRLEMAPHLCLMFGPAENVEEVCATSNWPAFGSHEEREASLVWLAAVAAASVGEEHLNGLGRLVADVDGGQRTFGRFQVAYSGVRESKSGRPFAFIQVVRDGEPFRE